MTMQTSGPISIGQARDEVQRSGQTHAGDDRLVALAGKQPGQRIAWSDWYGKSYGIPASQIFLTYYSRPFYGSMNLNLGRNLWLYNISQGTDRRGLFYQTGGDTTVSGSFPQQAINGLTLAGFYRNASLLSLITVISVNCSLDGVTFQSSVGDNFALTNDNSWSLAYGSTLVTFYGSTNGANAGGNISLNVRLSGSPNRPQPPSGYLNGQPYQDPNGGNSGSGGNH